MSQRHIVKTISIRHNYTGAERVEYARIVRGRAQFDKDERDLITSVQNDPAARSAAKLAEYSAPPEVSLSNYDANLTFKVTETLTEEDKSKVAAPSVTPPRRHVHVDPKTLNALLHGKILTIAEKRKLLESVLPDGILSDLIETDCALDCGVEA